MVFLVWGPKGPNKNNKNNFTLCMTMPQAAGKNQERSGHFVMSYKNDFGWISPEFVEMLHPWFTACDFVIKH